MTNYINPAVLVLLTNRVKKQKKNRGADWVRDAYFGCSSYASSRNAMKAYVEEDLGLVWSEELMQKEWSKLKRPNLMGSFCIFPDVLDWLKKIFLPF